MFRDFNHFSGFTGPNKQVFPWLTLELIVFQTIGKNLGLSHVCEFIFIRK